MEITIDGERAILRPNKITPSLLAVLPVMEGHKVWAKDKKSLRFDASAYNLGLLENSVGAKIIRPDAALATAFAPDPVKPAAPGSYWPSATEPMPHQKDFKDFVGNKKSVAIFSDQGTGKTKSLIDWANWLFQTSQITGHLVFSKKGAHRQWVEEEYPKHYKGEFTGQFWPFKDINPELLQRGNTLKVLSINWDAIRSQKTLLMAREFCAAHQGKMLITGDESQEIKDSGSGRHKQSKLLRAFASHGSIATGTPIAVDLTDEWAQLNWLNPDILGMKYVTTFRANYCRMGGFQNKQVIGHNNVEQFRKLTAPWVFRVTKEEIGLPPPLFSTWRFDLTPQQLRMITEIRRDLETEIDESGVTVTIDRVLTAFGKMSQIASGFIIDENRDVHRIMDIGKNPRIIRLMEWLDYYGDQRLLVWHRFTEDRNLILEALKSAGFPYLDYSSMSDNEWSEAKKEFRTPGGKLILVGNPQSGLGTGQNLQGACNNALYYSHSDRLIDRLQSQDRINRIGTIGTVTFSDLVGKKSPDIRVIGNNRRKQGISSMAIDGLRDLLRDMAQDC